MRLHRAYCGNLRNTCAASSMSMFRAVVDRSRIGMWSFYESHEALHQQKKLFGGNMKRASAALLSLLAVGTFLASRWPSLQAGWLLCARHDCGRTSVRGAPCSAFVFGFSTGHVGTTTLSKRQAYRSGERELDHIVFAFETGVATQAQYNTMTAADEAAHVRRVYLPALHRARSTPSLKLPTCVDLSHANLFFYNGLLSQLVRSGAPISFLRLRRARCEVARSIAFDATYSSTAKMLQRRFASFAKLHPGCPRPLQFCPLVNSQRVLLRISAALWTNLSALQKAMWAIDETEARWRAFLPRLLQHNVSVHELSWSKAVEGSFRLQAESIAGLIGLRLASSIPDHKLHVTTTSPPPLAVGFDRINASSASSSDELRQWTKYHHVMSGTCKEYSRTFPARAHTDLGLQSLHAFWYTDGATD